MAFDLKQEGDVKEYIEKLGIEYRFGCYNEKKPEGKLNVIQFSHIDNTMVSDKN